MECVKKKMWRGGGKIERRKIECLKKKMWRGGGKMEN